MRSSGTATKRNRPGAGRTKTPAAAVGGSKPRTGNFTTRAAILMSVALLLFASYTSSLHTWWQQRGEIQATKAEIAMGRDANFELADERERWNDPAFVEQQARERFG